jgi:cobalamin biosynthesis protein CbiD
MDFSEQKKHIRAMMQVGDLQAIAQKAGVSTPRLKEVFEKNSINEMTPTQRRAWIAAIEFMEERIKENQQLQERTEKLVNQSANL